MSGPNYLVVIKLPLRRSDPAATDRAERGERSYPTPEVRAAAKRSYHMSKEQRLCGRRRAKRRYSMFKVRRGCSEEIPLLQGKK